MKSFVFVAVQVIALVCLFGLWIAPITRSIDPEVTDLVVFFGRFGCAALIVIFGVKLRDRIKGDIYPEKIRSFLGRRGFINILEAGFYLAVSYFAYTRSFRLSFHLAPALSLGNIPIVWVVLLSARKAWRKTPLTLAAAIGIIVITFAFLVPCEGGNLNAAAMWGLIASFFLALFLLKAESLPCNVPSYAVVAWYCIVGTVMGFCGLMATISFDDSFIRIPVDPVFWLQMVCLGIGTAAAFFLYDSLLKRVSPLVVSSFLVLTPAANSLMDKIFQQNKITSYQVTGVWLVCLGLVALYAVKSIERKKQRE